MADITIKGRLTDFPVEKGLDNGGRRVNFTVVENHWRKDESGKWVEDKGKEPIFWNCAAFDAAAGQALALGKGESVEAKGTIKLAKVDEGKGFYANVTIKEVVARFDKSVANQPAPAASQPVADDMPF